jgi:hypothetical protein
MKPFTVKITQAMIDKAMASTGTVDFLTEAVKATKDVKNVCWDTASVRFTDKSTGVRHICPTPPLARIAMLKFDNGEHIQPFNIMLKPT